MKQKHPGAGSGIRIDNTLSIALRRRTASHPTAPLVFLSMLGAVSCCGTFLSMFSPVGCAWVVLLFTAAVAAFFSWHAAHPEGRHLSMLAFFALYGAVFFFRRQALVCGYSSLMNAIYQTIYKSDWEYFTADMAYDPERSTVLFLCAALVPLVWLLCYAIIRYRSFLLSLLVSLPIVELGFFFGVAPDHVPASALFAFWCGAAALQLGAGSGIMRRNGQTGFVRRKNTFAPVCGMRFLVGGKAGVTAAVIAFVLCMGTDCLLKGTGYERPNVVKVLRNDFQYYSASIDWSDLSTVFPFLKSPSEENDILRMGRIDKQIFEDDTVSEAFFEFRPEGRVYLKYRTFHLYDRSSWKKLSDADLAVPLPDVMQQTGWSEEDFLGASAAMLQDTYVEMHLHTAEEELQHSVPYGCWRYAELPDPGFPLAAGDTAYEIFSGGNYEELLADTTATNISSDRLVQGSMPEIAALLGTQRNRYLLPDLHYGGPELSTGATSTVPAVLGVCGYTDYAYANFTQLPDTAAMQRIRDAYGDLLAGYDARTASPAETIALLRKIRERLCNTVSYTLSPGKTPPYEDFVAWFLLEHRQGYCMHYATAGTILARMAGIPARYCEGYLISEDDLSEKDGHWYAQMKDSSAHAWTEIYLEGIGWIPFEFTFSYFTPPPTEALPTETVPETTELPSESVTAEATAPPPAPPVATLPAETVPEEITQQESALLPMLLMLGILTGICLVIGGFVLARRIALRRQKMRLLQQDPAAAGAYAWQRILRCMERIGVDTHVPTAAALEAAALELCEPYLEQTLLTDAIRAGIRLRYSPHPPDAEELRALRRAAVELPAAICKQASPVKRFWLRWILHYV